MFAAPLPARGCAVSTLSRLRERGKRSVWPACAARTCCRRRPAISSVQNNESSGRNRMNQSHGRFCRHRSRLRRRRARQPPDRERPPSGAAAGGGRRDASALARADQLCALHQPSRRELALCLRARAEHRRPQHPGAARKNARRVERDQRHGVGARPAPGLRPLGAARKPRLELARRAAAVQGHRELSRRRGRAARPRRAAARHRHRRERAALRQPVRGGGEHRDPAQPRLQRRRPGGHRDDAMLDQRRLPHEHREGLSRSGARAAQFPGRHRRARAMPAVRGHALRRRALHHAGRDLRGARGARGDRVGRLDRLAATARAFRHRAERAAQGRSASR